MWELNQVTKRPPKGIKRCNFSRPIMHANALEQNGTSPLGTRLLTTRWELRTLPNFKKNLENLLRKHDAGVKWRAATLSDFRILKNLNLMFMEQVWDRSI